MRTRFHPTHTIAGVPLLSSSSLFQKKKKKTKTKTKTNTT